MALELTLKRSKQPVYPTKTTINLASCNQPPRNNVRAVILFAVAIVAIAVFAKFGVVDVLSSAANASSKTAGAQAQLDQLTASNADYATLQEQYSTYVVNTLSAEEMALANRETILGLIQSTVANIADLQSVNISGNTVSLQFINTSLDDVSRVVGSLENNELVAGVSMSTAKTNKNDDVVSTVTITLKGLGNETDASAANSTQASESAQSSNVAQTSNSAQSGKSAQASERV